MHENLCQLDSAFELNLQKFFSSTLLKKYCLFPEVVGEETIESMKKDLIQDIEVLKSQFNEKYQYFWFYYS